MPGGRLNDTERSLAKRWDQADGYQYPTLRAVSVAGESGLRGVRNLHLEFRYPLTVLIGRNGTGKSTLLALAALAFHSPPGHLPVNALRHPSPGESSSYYTFSDFFFRGPGDTSGTGVEITWQYSGKRPPLTIRRRTERKWMRYERRPIRPVHFVGIARTVPAIERRVLRAHFPPTPRSVTSHALDDTYVAQLSKITGLQYEGAQVLTASRYELRAVRGTNSYSSFNMGAGEDILIEILYLIQTAPKGSLIVIEEVELGLHPRAVKELAGVLLETANARSLQIVVSSHSADFIDAVPRQARILLDRMPGGGETTHHITYSPTTRLALGELMGGPYPEVTLYCEDEFAKQLIVQALPDSVYRRVQVHAVGSDNQLASHARFHAKTGAPGRALLVWDGDVSDRQADEWLDRVEPSFRATIEWIRLPGDTAPERWVAEVLFSDAGVTALARHLNAAPNRVKGVIAGLKRLSDHHALAWEFGAAFCRPEDQARTILMLAVREVAWEEFAHLRNKVASLLDDPSQPPSAV